VSDIPQNPGAAEELDSLLGAYALDALEAADRERVDAYLERDPTARAEVDDLRETAAALALVRVTDMDAPPEVWERIAGAIEAERARAADQEPGAERQVAEQHIDEVAARRARRTRAQWMTVAAAAAVVALVVLAAQVASLRGQLDRAHRLGPAAMAAAFERATKVDGAEQVGLASESGATLARVVLLPDGTGYLRGDRLTALTPDRTYQLWAVTGDPQRPVTVSAGVLGPDPKAVSFRASGPVQAFAVTIERAGGVVKSAHTPIAQGAVT
jgi:anti-sigma-K factor RskA